MNIAKKIIAEHLISGTLTPGEEISIKIDQTLTQDSTGTMAYLQFEAMAIPRVKTKKSVAYIDHNTLQSGFENADDHKYIQTVANKHGIYFSRPGNGICHQVHLERFGIPGQTLLGSDSHTPTCGGIGMLAIGAGGLDVAVSMGGGAYHLKMPEIFNIHLTGKLQNNATAKDVILHILRTLTVKGGVGKIMEYTGPGVETLTVPERATITNMGAELGATTSIFPGDHVTKAFLDSQGRSDDFIELKPDPDAQYDHTLEVNLDQIKPLAACPHSPDNVKEVSQLSDIKVDQVAIGSCTNASYRDLMITAEILKGNTVHKDVSLVIAPGSKQVYSMLAKNGALKTMIDAGARILEAACGPCIGMGQSPRTNAVSLRTFNRNFYARSGTASAQVYLVSPQVAAASALAGYITEPSIPPVEIEMPTHFDINDNMIVPPTFEGEVVKGPNIKEFPQNTPLDDSITAKALIKLPDNITTDHIMPSNSKLLPYRSNIPYLSSFCLEPSDKDFAARAKEHGKCFIIAGMNYGQGSSREHAALVPLYLGVKAVIAKSFARIHEDNLKNSGILPLTFVNPDDYENIEPMDQLEMNNLRECIQNGYEIDVVNLTQGKTIKTRIALSERQRAICLAGGLINSIKSAQ